jgi:hypothetical protein
MAGRSDFFGTAFLGAVFVGVAFFGVAFFGITFSSFSASGSFAFGVEADVGIGGASSVSAARTIKIAVCFAGASGKRLIP